MELNLTREDGLELEPEDPKTLLADGFEEALMGYGTRFTHGVAVYSKRKCLDVLVERDEMSRDEALEYFDFNVSGSYVGEGTPVFLTLWDKDGS